MSEWIEYTGSDEQIAELRDSKNGFVLRHSDGTQSLMLESYPVNVIGKFTHYWIIPADPLREMKIRQAQTGQPVWVKEGIDCMKPFIYETHNPDWNIPNAEYSFTPFDGERVIGIGMAIPNKNPFED